VRKEEGGVKRAGGEEFVSQILQGIYIVSARTYRNFR
jgi:hypothetical protein